MSPQTDPPPPHERNEDEKMDTIPNPTITNHHSLPSPPPPTNTSTSTSTAISKRNTTIAFWLMGLFNNTPYVVMIAGAKQISEGGTALVFIANVLPSLFVKLSAPYWFHLVSYRKRILVSSLLFGLSFLVVAYFSRQYEYLEDEDGDENGKKQKRDVGWELIGVALTSLAGGVGEPSLLALAGLFSTTTTTVVVASSEENVDRMNNDEHEDDTNNRDVNDRAYLTAFSSGTGLAGVVGYAWVAMFHLWMGLSFTWTLILAIVFPFGYFLVFERLLGEGPDVHFLNNDDDEDQQSLQQPSGYQQGVSEHGGNIVGGTNNTTEYQAVPPFSVEQNQPLPPSPPPPSSSPSSVMQKNVQEMNKFEKTRLVLSLWPYMIPLFFVYAAEYALQSGTWTAIGFPSPSSKASRDTFYEYSNWTYQIGVFLSRSSGTIFQASMPILWIMPILQICNFLFFYYTAAFAEEVSWYGWGLLIGCLFAGCLGGGVYVNAFTRIQTDIPRCNVEFALSSASVADTLGILMADVLGLFIQGCLYEKNGIDGAVVQCPF